MAIRKGVHIGIAAAGLAGLLGTGAGATWLCFRAAGALSLPGAASWRHHRDPMGFSVDLPRDWTLKPDAGSGRIELAGQAGERLVVWPLFMAADPGSRAGTLLSRVAERVWPEARWGPAETVGQSVWRVRGSAGQARGACVLACLPTAKGTAAFAYLMQAIPGQAPQAEETFARILGAFQLEGRAAETPAPPALRYERWTDPRERAFSAEFPAGWRVSGGALRPSTLLVQSEVQALSPEGDLALYLGDAFPIFVEPNAMLAFGGIRPGGTYVDATGYGHPVAPYTPGLAYATQAILPRRVGAFQILNQADRPELARRLWSLGINRFDAGEVDYQFQRGGRDYHGWLLCITERLTAPQVTNWHVWRLCLAEAPVARFGEAREALERAVSTFQIDPAWAQGQARLTATQSRIIADMGEATSRSILETGRFHAQTIDEINRRGANARRGVEEVVDPHTGRQMTVSSGSNYYWVDNHGTVLGTDTSTKPNLDFRALTRLP